MQKPPAITSWKITCHSPEDSRTLQQWLYSRIDLDRVLTNAVRTIPDGVEYVQKVPHRLGDYFMEISIMPDSKANPKAFQVVFHKRPDAGRFWKDLMVNILQEIEANPQKASIDLYSKRDLHSTAETPADEFEAPAKQIAMGKESIEWNYPVYAIETGPNQVLALIGDGEDRGRHALLVFQTEDGAIAYISASQTTGMVRPLKDESALYQLLKGLDHSVDLVLFNPKVTGSAAPIAFEWRDRIDSLLISHFSHILDEWDYPLYAISAGNGYVCLRGPTKSGTTEINAICVFTDEDLANRYVAQSSISGAVHEIPTPQAFRRLLETRTDVQGVCFDSMPVERTWSCVSLADIVSRLSAMSGTSLPILKAVEMASANCMEQVAA